jgi:hypothetical protein
MGTSKEEFPVCVFEWAAISVIVFSIQRTNSQSTRIQLNKMYTNAYFPSISPTAGGLTTDR